MSYRISIIEPIGGHGGNEFYDLGLAEFLMQTGIDVSLYTCDETTLDNYYSFKCHVDKCFRHIYNSDHQVLRGLRYIQGSFQALIRSIKSKSQLAHFHIYHFSILELFNIVLFRLFRFPIVATIHDVDSFENYGKENVGFVGWKQRFMLKLIGRLIVHTDYAKTSLLSIGADESKIRLVTHGDTDFIYGNLNCTKREARSRLGLKGDLPTILFFGQIKAVKGLDILIKAMVGIDARLYVVGKCWKQDLEDYISIVEENKLEDKIIFINKFIDTAEVPYYFKAADWCCLPYKKIYSSGVLLRTMDYNTPIICSDLEPFKKIIMHNKSGLIFESENVESLNKMIKYALALNTKERQKLADLAKETVDSSYSWAVVAEQTKRVYEEML